jgi:2-methylisocitrate lyase-like PEP mutase family enzyme
VIELAEAAKKIEAAVAARSDPDFIIIARTDSAAGHGLDDAINRVQTFRKAGADVLFVELKTSPTILEDMKRITSSVDGPCLVNIDGGGKLGELSAAEIEKLGFRIAIFPGLARNAAVFAIREAVNALKRDGNTKTVSDRMVTMKEYNEVLQLGDVEEWERKYLQT